MICFINILLFAPWSACNEAYTHDAEAVYACTVGCTVNVDAVVGDDGMTEVTMISNVMDLMLLSRLVDLFSISSSNLIPVSDDDDSNEWSSNELDVYMPEVCVCVCVCVCVHACVIYNMCTSNVHTCTHPGIFSLVLLQGWNSANSSSDGTTGQSHDDHMYILIP